MSVPSVRLFASVAATTEIEAVNVMLATIGETPINSFEEVTADVAIARNTLTEVSRAVQLEGWQWNTEDHYPLSVNIRTHKIKMPPDVLRVHFNHPECEQLTQRGAYVYDRLRHTFIFPDDKKIFVTLTKVLPFHEIPESARAYIVIRSARVFQERVVGAHVLSQFTRSDEARARAEMMGEERRLDRPNVLRGILPPMATWHPITSEMNRASRIWRIR